MIVNERTRAGSVHAHYDTQLRDCFRRLAPTHKQKLSTKLSVRTQAQSVLDWYATHGPTHQRIELMNAIKDFDRSYQITLRAIEVHNEIAVEEWKIKEAKR